MPIYFHKWRVRGLAGAILVAVGLTAVAALVRAATGMHFPEVGPFATFQLAVLLATLIGGRVAGAVVLGLGLILANFLFVPPLYRFGDLTVARSGATAVFLVIGATIIAVVGALRDSLDRERERERRLTRAQQVGVMGDWDWDMVSGRITWSDNMYVITGQDPARFTPTLEGMLALIHRDDIARMRAAMLEPAADATRFDVECRILRGDGAVRDIECRGEIQRDVYGHPLRIVGIKLDVTERAQLGRALAASEARYRTLFTSMTEAFAVYDIIRDDQGAPVDFRVIEANPAFAAITGLATDAVVGRLASEVAPGADPDWLRFYAEIARTGEAAAVERYVPSLNRWIDMRGFAQGPDRVGAVFLDITPRKAAEAERAAAEAVLHHAMEVAEVGAYHFDPARRTVIASGSTERIFGFDDHREVRPIEAFTARLLPDDRDRLAAETARALASGGAFGLEYRVIAPDGSPRWVVSRGRVGAGLDGSARISGAVFDITERKRAESAAEAARAHTELMFREMNHRTKNNLQIVSSLLRLQGDGDGRGSLRDHLDAARERIATVAELHETLYRGATIGDVDFAAYLTVLASRIEASMGAQHGIRVAVEAEPATLPADAAIPLGLVVNELATNAIKHAFGGGGGGVEPVIAVSLRRRDGHLVLGVADNGLGLPDGWPVGGRGMGTRLIAAFVRQVGGTLAVVPGPGARFEITVPLAGAA